jgi:hypothetical protein
MASPLEQNIARSLRAILADLLIGESVPDSEQFRRVLTDLEWFIPGIFGEVYREMAGQGLDGVYSVLARKTGEAEVEILGVCCFILDQRLTPLHLHFQIADGADEVSWLEWRLGERGPHGMVRQPYDHLSRMTRRLLRLGWQGEPIDWVYKVTFGERRR